MNPVIKALLDRMFTFNEQANFEGYPSLNPTDEDLVFEAAKQNQSEDSVIFLAFVISENAETREQYDNCKRFFDAYVEHIWCANMTEGGNAVWDQINGGEEE